MAAVHEVVQREIIRELVYEEAVPVINRYELVNVGSKVYDEPKVAPMKCSLSIMTVNVASASEVYAQVPARSDL